MPRINLHKEKKTSQPTLTLFVLLSMKHNSSVLGAKGLYSAFNKFSRIIPVLTSTFQKKAKTYKL